MRAIFFLLLLLPIYSHAAGIERISRQDGFYNIKYYPESQKPSPYQERYHQSRGQFNNLVMFLNSTIKDSAFESDDHFLYNVTYTINELGMRATPAIKENLTQHLIVAGDSNTFGIGCNDNETISYLLSQKFPQYAPINMGFPGAGLNHTLRFLETFHIKEIAPASYKKGVFLIDFRPSTIERIIGGKNFMNWGKSAPKYKLDKNDNPVYQGPYSDSWEKHFYAFLDLFPYSNRLFPNFPRISDRHIELTARIIVAIKERYLKDTSPDNKFIVILDPEYNTALPGDLIQKNKEELKVKLIKYKIDFIDFDQKEILPLPRYNKESHFTPLAHKNFVEMIYPKLKDKI